MFPDVVVARIASDVEHRVQRTGAAYCFATRPVGSVLVHAETERGRRLRLELPVERRELKRRVGERQVAEHRLVSAGFQ